MTSRELVRSAVRCEPTPRVPRQLWLLPWATAHYSDEIVALKRDFPDDIVNPPRTLPRLERMRGDIYAVG